jgi:hypothetical protein
MRFFKAIAFVGTVAAGGLGLMQVSASATPLSAAIVAGNGEPSLVSKVYYYGRPHYGYRPVAPVYRGYYRRGPRVVCRTYIRVVRTPYGRLVRRPVQVCTRRY